MPGVPRSAPIPVVAGSQAYPPSARVLFAFGGTGDLLMMETSGPACLRCVGRASREQGITRRQKLEIIEDRFIRTE
jgi:hypothetical protein